MLIELLLLLGDEPRSKPLHIAPDEIDEAFSEPSLALRRSEGTRVRSDDRLPKEEVEGQRRVDDLRNRNAAGTERERLAGSELLAADREYHVGDARGLTETFFDGEKLVEGAVSRKALLDETADENRGGRLM